ncbi:hypothetical protein ABH922_001227 [Rhodococcus sp. 27YEA15]
MRPCRRYPSGAPHPLATTNPVQPSPHPEIVPEPGGAAAGAPYRSHYAYPISGTRTVASVDADTNENPRATLLGSHLRHSNRQSIFQRAVPSGIGGRSPS